MGACVFGKGELDIDIGDYEYHLEAWNNQNMLDYQIEVIYMGSNRKTQTLITVKNNIPESNDSSYWLEENRKSTIPEFYSLIKSYEKIFRDAHNSGDNRLLSLKVSYNTKYHYPTSIISKVNGSTTQHFIISLKPLGE